MKILGGLVFLGVAISLPVTIFLVNQRQTLTPQAKELPSAQISITPGCPAVNPDGSTNICRPQSYCNPGEIVKYEGNEMCTTSLGRNSFCCTIPK
jgi:hypothetical protein